MDRLERLKQFFNSNEDLKEIFMKRLEELEARIEEVKEELEGKLIVMKEEMKKDIAGNK